MAGNSNIEWTDATWNPIVGCSILTPGCTNCYAMKMAARIETMKHSHYDGTTKKVNGKPVWTGKMALAPDHILLQPLKWKRARRIFVNSMGDLFHESIPDEWIDRAFAVMALSPQHTFQVLTKRAERMHAAVLRIGTSINFLEKHARAMGRTLQWSVPSDLPHRLAGKTVGLISWPLPNVWLGVSTERQKEADERIPLLLQTPSAVRFISAEPLLGPIDLRNIQTPRTKVSALDLPGLGARLDWVIAGGESGHNARSFHIEWADSIVAQCRAAGVACFVKQLGAVPISDGYPLELKSGKGGDQDEWPERLRVRQFPQQHRGMAA